MTPGKPFDPFADLAWHDLDQWAGSRIVGRGRKYQQQGRVSKLAQTDQGTLIAWVKGTERYANIVMTDEVGLPESTCTCPYGIDCKHGVAVVLEYLECLEKARRVPTADKNDERFQLLNCDDFEDEWDPDVSTLSPTTRAELNAFLKKKTKAQIIEILDGLDGQLVVKKRR
jgi:uncharacterized Zn finger protein